MQNTLRLGAFALSRFRARAERRPTLQSKIQNPKLPAPPQPLAHPAAHHPLEVVSLQPGQVVSEHMDAFVVGALHPRKVGPPEHSLRPERIEQLPKYPCTSANGYASLDQCGIPEDFTAMFGCFASAQTAGKSSQTVGSSAGRNRTPTWSITNFSPGCAVAIRSSTSRLPGTSTISGIPAVSAAGQSQSADPSVSRCWLCRLWKVNRIPSIPGCSLHRGTRSRLLGSQVSRPITAKRSG